MPLTSTATAGTRSGAREMDATEIAIAEESSEEVAVQQLVSIQNVNY
jgi:hypothetical protein